MKTVRLGKTGLKVSRVGIGGIPIQRPPENEAIKVIRRALDLGVNLIDTSIGYGDSEERIGKGIAGRREQVIIATKGRWKDRATALENIERSLERLNTGYIDLWQFHGVNTLEGYEGVLGPDGAMEGAQVALQAGKIRHIGISSHSPDVAKRAVVSGHFETIQFPFNFVARELAEELAPLAREHDVGFIAMKPFAGGMLRKARLAIKYLLQFDRVVPIPGVEKAVEIEEIVDIVNNEPWDLKPQERQEIEEIRARVGTRFCRRCRYCMPCPQDVEIQPLMTLPVLWELWPSGLSFSERSIGGYVTHVVESAENCVQCGECEEKCPYELPIREMMVENIALYERAAAEHNARQDASPQ
ncbi:MAG: aldo/keto reductase [Chloroflexota bacterium]|nr:aldo/keto reductase [Chloroflexota bacterium]